MNGGQALMALRQRFPTFKWTWERNDRPGYTTVRAVSSEQEQVLEVVQGTPAQSWFIQMETIMTENT